MGHLWPFSVQGHFGVIQWTYLKMTCNAKIAGRRAKRSEIWDSWGTCIITYMGAPLTVYCSMSFGVICCICLNMAWNLKTTDRRAKPKELWDSQVLTCIWGTFGVHGRLRSFCAFLKMVCNSKISGCRVKQSEISKRWEVVSCMGYFNVAFSCKGHFGVIQCICLKWPRTQKQFTVEWNGVKFKIWRETVDRIGCTFWPAE